MHTKPTCDKWITEKGISRPWIDGQWELFVSFFFTFHLLLLQLYYLGTEKLNGSLSHLYIYRPHLKKFTSYAIVFSYGTSLMWIFKVSRTFCVQKSNAQRMTVRFLVCRSSVQHQNKQSSEVFSTQFLSLLFSLPLLLAHLSSFSVSIVTQKYI